MSLIAYKASGLSKDAISAAISISKGDTTTLLFEKKQKVFFRNPPSPLPKGAPPLPVFPLLRRGKN